MEIIHSVKPLVAVAVSFLAAPVLASSRHPNIRETWTFVAAIIKLGIVVSLLPAVLDGKIVELMVFEVMPGVGIQFRVDALGMIFALVASILWIFTSAYTIGYMRGLDEHAQTRFFCFFALALSSTLGVAFAGNMFTLYLFYEMLSFATYPLVTHHQDAESRTSGRKYLTYIVGASIGLALPAMLVIYHLAGTLSFAPGGILNGVAAPTTVLILALMVLFGFAKAGVMPFHGWLPAAMVAPTPVSALLHAVAVVKVGAFSIVRVYTGIFGVPLLSNLHLGTVVAAIASFTIITASLIALSQDGLKRRLAFSTVGQLSYIVLGIALLSPKGMLGGVLHIAMHAFGKITLFFCAGAIYVATHKKNISDMVGLGRRMPVTMGAFAIGALSVIGLPPCGGFISKWYLVLGTLEAGQLVFLVVLLTSSLLNAAYFLPVVYKAFFCTPEESQYEDRIEEAPAWCVVPLVGTALISVGLFFYPQPFLNLARMVVAGLTGGG